MGIKINERFFSVGDSVCFLSYGRFKTGKVVAINKHGCGSPDYDVTVQCGVSNVVNGIGEIESWKDIRTFPVYVGKPTPQCETWSSLFHLDTIIALGLFDLELFVSKDVDL